MLSRATKINEAIDVLNSGGIVIFPTDTAFGIGCRIDSEDSVKRLFHIRKRPMTQATPVLVSSISMAKQYLQPVSKTVEELMNTCWPGGLTIVYRCITDKIPSLVRGGRDTLGVRMPDHELTLELINRVGVPILGPSANFHGEKTPFAYSDLNPDLLKLVDYVLPGECKTKIPSTVIDCSVTPPKIIRQGAVVVDAMKIPVILAINTSQRDTTKVSLTVNGKHVEKSSPSRAQASQTLLPLIDELLKEQQLTIQDVTSIMVHTGPGSFTGLRVGASVANALGWSLKIPVNGRTNTITIPTYEP